MRFRKDIMESSRMKLMPPESNTSNGCQDDIAGLNGLVPTLLVLGAHSGITEDFRTSLSFTQRVEAIRKVMKEVRRLLTKR